MRRLIVEIPMDSLDSDLPLQKVKTFEVLHILKLTRKVFSAISKVEFKDHPLEITQLLPHTAGFTVRHEVLECRGKTMTYFFSIFSRGKTQRPIRLPVVKGGFISTPFEIKNGKLRVTYLADSREVEKIINILDQSTMTYGISSITDAKISPDSPLASLTDRQFEVVKRSFQLGYYDRPRRVKSEQIAGTMGISKATFVAHRRKAERRLLNSILVGLI